MTTSLPDPATTAGRRPHPRWARLGLTLPGAWVALALACLSFLPSLIPRPVAFQGALTGVNAALGDGLGVLGRGAGGSSLRVTPDRRPLVSGDGHNFAGEHVDAWAQVLRSQDWMPARFDALREAVRTHAGSAFTPTE